MKLQAIILFATTALLSISSAVYAAPFWASNVEEYGAGIQNFGIRGAGSGELMTPATEFWLLGAPDAMPNNAGNGLDPDHVAGWRSDAPDQFIVVEFDLGILDIAGDDLLIRMFSGPNAEADVFGSVDGSDFKKIGSLGPGTPLGLRNETFDFAGLFDDPVRFVSVERVANGRQTGMFLDAVGGYEVVPLPPAIAVLAPPVALLALAARRARRRGLAYGSPRGI